VSSEPIAVVPAPRRSGVVRAGLLSMLGLVALGGTRLVHGALVGRATDHETYALVGTLIGVGMTAGLFLPLGLSTAASKFIPFHRGKNDPGTARGVYHLLSWVGIVTALGLGGLVGLGTAQLLTLSVADTIAVSLFTAIFSMYSIEKGALYGFDRIAPYARLEIGGSVVAVAATVVVVSVGARAYLMPLILGYSVLIVGAWIILRRGHHVPAVRVPRPERREITEFVVLASAGGLASAGLLQLLPLLATGFTNKVEVSYFVAAVTLVAPLYFLPRALGMALFPAMAHAHGTGDTDAVRRHADISTRALLVLLAPLFALAIPLAREVLLIFYGSPYAPGAPVLQLLLVATYVAVIQVAAVNALSSGTRREVRIPVYSGIGGCLLGLALLIPLGGWFGAAGVGLAYFVAVAAYTATPVIAAWRRYEMRWAGPLTRSLVVVAVALAAALVSDAAGMAGAGRVLLDVGLAVGLAAAGGVVLRRDIMALVGARASRS
jgi:O-antigen/teichoic acid export membrane protein